MRRLLILPLALSVLSGHLFAEKPAPAPAEKLQAAAKDAAAKPAGPELVMEEGDRITATTGTGTIRIDAGKGLLRTYTWEGASRSATLEARTERWYGSLGAYYPGPGEHWENHGGITRGVLQEGQQHFPDKAAALAWLKEQAGYYPTVYTNTGLVVSFGKVMERRQLNAEVWQIHIKGKPPVSLEGAKDDAIRFKAAATASGK